MSKTTNKFSPEVRERAVRMVLDGEGPHGARWQAIVSIASKIGCSANTMNAWVKRAEADRGNRAGVSTDAGVSRDIAAKRPAPKMLWVSAFTYVTTWKSFAYVAFVIDAYLIRFFDYIWFISS